MLDTAICLYIVDIIFCDDNINDFSSGYEYRF